MATVNAKQRPAMVVNQRNWPLVLGLLIGLGFLWGGRLWWADRSYRHAIMVIELEMANARFGIAARELDKLLEQDPTDAEAAILLGRCEQERGRYKAAGEALARVPPGTALYHKATLARMRLLHDQGQFAAAEQLITNAALDPRSDPAHLRVLLVPIYSQLGRSDEAVALLEAWWTELNNRRAGASEQAIDQVRMHIELDLKPNPVEAVRSYLDEASTRAATDDRIWLGRANLAIRTGDFNEAKRLLDECLKVRQEDAPIWSAWLRLGMKSNQTNLVAEAMTHLPAHALRPAQIHRLGAWLCALRGDTESEQRQLERLLAVEPGNLEALDRLAELTKAAGESRRFEELAAQRSEVTALRTVYEKLFDRNQPIRDAEGMARIAARLGRIFEARAFLTVEIAADPERADLRRDLLRLGERATPTPSHEQTLAEVMARELGRHEKVDAKSVN